MPIGRKDTCMAENMIWPNVLRIESTQKAIVTRLEDRQRRREERIEEEGEWRGNGESERARARESESKKEKGREGDRFLVAKKHCWNKII